MPGVPLNEGTQRMEEYRSRKEKDQAKRRYAWLRQYPAIMLAAIRYKNWRDGALHPNQVFGARRKAALNAEAIVLLKRDGADIPASVAPEQDKELAELGY